MTDAKLGRAALMRDINFRWLLAGGAISMLGDQLSVMALPWLVLKLTGDTFATGAVIAIVGVPRAIFILLGGAFVDRYSPKKVLMLTKYVNAVLLGVLSLLMLSSHLTLSIVYALALGIGLASAFSIPSGTALLPQVIAPGQLQLANSLQMGMRQLTFFVGPLLAGLLISQSGNDATQSISDARGLGLAFGLDCMSFIVSAWTLSKVPLSHAATLEIEPILGAVGAGLVMVWRDREMRSCFGYWAIVTFFTGGTVQVAIPVLASTQWGGAASFGLLAGALGAGTLIGIVATGLIGNRRVGNLGSTVLLIDGIVGAVSIPMGYISAVWQGVILLMLIGALTGFIQVAVFTWLQRRVPPTMLGRTMSIFMFIFMGLAPLSALSTGWLMRYVSIAQLFAGAGWFLLGAASIAFFLTPMRHMTDAPT